MLECEPDSFLYNVENDKSKRTSIKVKANEVNVIAIDFWREKSRIAIDREVWECHWNAAVGPKCRPVIGCYCTLAVFILENEEAISIGGELTRGTCGEL